MNLIHDDRRLAPASTRARVAARPHARVALGAMVAFCSIAMLGCGGSEQASDAEPASAGGSADAPSDPFRVTDEGLYRVALAPRQAPAPVGPLHEWVLRVRDADGRGFEPRRIAVDGGMPQHGHGFVTAPRVTRRLAPGTYLVEGVKFHMGGDWVLRVELVSDAGPDGATFEVHLGP